MVFSSSQQFMDIWFSSPNSIKHDFVFCEVNVRAHQFVRASSFDQPPVSHDFDIFIIGCPSNENDLAHWPCVIVQHPVFRKSPAHCCLIHSLLVFVSDGINIKPRLFLHGVQVLKMKSFPHAVLPTTVVTFNRCLESCFSRRHEHRRDAQTQTTSHDFSQRVRPSTSLKNGGVVELRIVGQSEFAPMFDHLLYRIFRCHPAHGPRADKFSMQRNRVEYLKNRSSFDAQIFNVIELIQFGDFLCERLQIPTGRRRFETFSLSSVEFAVPFQNAMDGCSRRQERAFALFHFPENGIGSMLSECAVFLELFSQGQHALLDFGGCAIAGLRRSVWSITPIDTVEPFAFGTRHPTFDGRFANPKLFCNLAKRLPLADGFNRRPTILRKQALRFVSYSNPFKKQTFKIIPF